GRMTRAPSHLSVVKSFAYEGESQRIKTITDGQGAVRRTLDYDDKGRVVRERDEQGLRDNEAVTFAYEDLPDGSVTTTVIYPPSLLEPGWHPVLVEIDDAQGRLRERR